MPAADKPADEAARQATLDSYAILDTPPDPRFDVFTRLAAELCGTPMAAVSLIDRERQWFKSSLGLDLAQTPRDHAFCAHAILSPQQALTVEDATADVRFADNPLVTEAPGLRFYAGVPITAPNGQPVGTLCVMDSRSRRIAPETIEQLRALGVGVAGMLEMHRATTALHRAATHDPLTGLANRTLFEPRLEQAVAAAHADRPVALLYVDLDGLKGVNDGLGHAAGDMLLTEAARRLTACVRPADLIARLGGDEFAVLLADGAEPAGLAVAARLRQMLSTHLHIEGRVVTTAASIGIAFAPHDGTDGPALLRAADEAMLQAKRSGRNRVVRAADRLGATRHGRADDDRVERLRAAIADGAMSHAWQPIFDIRTDGIIGYEALIRWGSISPNVFVPLAEKTGLIRRLDAWSMRSAVLAAADWPEPLDVAVNLAPESFAAFGLADEVAVLLDATGMAPDRLVIELTERTLIDHPDAVRANMMALRRRGVRIALDDFGVGYSALGLLKAFPFDKLKLDRLLVQDLTTDARADAIARAAIRLGHDLGLRVLAEGVETAAQLAFLRTEGCDLAQGYLLGRPGPAPG